MQESNSHTFSSTSLGWKSWFTLLHSQDCTSPTDFMGTLENGAGSYVVSESLAESTGTNFTKAGENLLSILEQTPVIRNGSRLNFRLKFWFEVEFPCNLPWPCPTHSFSSCWFFPWLTVARFQALIPPPPPTPTADRMSFGCSFDLLSLVRQRRLF